MDFTRQLKIKERLEKFVDDGILLGAAIAGIGGTDAYSYTAGYQDVAKTKPMSKRSIIRNASDGKIVGSVAFLRLVERGIITAHEDVSQWIPAFAQTKVIEPFTPASVVALTNPFVPTSDDHVLKVLSPDHGLSTGDLVGFQGASAAHGVSPDVLNRIHEITVLNSDEYTITLSVTIDNQSSGGAGGNVIQSLLGPGVKQTVYKGATHYYTEVALKRSIKIWHILTHTLGYLYNFIPLGATLGYADGRGDPVRVKKTQIQAGIFQELMFPAAFPLVHNNLYPNIKAWANVIATVPLLFQPGEDWSYGPTLSILGALIEYIDGRDLQTYLKEEVTGPLEMHDTGFFIQNDDPDRADKLSRIHDLTVTVSPGVFIDANTVIPGIGDYFYAESQPKNLPLIDGGIYSTLNDRSRFFRMLLNGGRYDNSLGESRFLISPATIQLLSHNRINNLVAMATFPPVKNPKWGLGVGVLAGSDDSATLLGQTRHAIFWGGLFGTCFDIDWTNRSAINFVANTMDAGGIDRSRRLIMNVHAAALKTVEVNDEDGAANAPQPVQMYQ